MEPRIKEWHEFYTDWTVEDYRRHVKAVKGFAHRLMRFTPKDGVVLEVGFGSGQISIYLSLSHKDLDVIGIDKDPVQVVRALKLADELKAEVHFFYRDFMKRKVNKINNRYDMVFSQGLLEHFSDKDIELIIKGKIIFGKRVAFSVPLKAFGHKSRGDERLMEWSWWLDKIKDYKILYEETYAKNTQGMVIFEAKK